jgi:hypothetical protein
MPNISDKLMRKQWDAALDLVTMRATQDWDRRFVRDMRSNTLNREDVMILTGTPWNPTVKQWNQLMSMRDKFT